jgi:D-glycero-alpha-D-manno-heptose-7-phosphate kinase
MRIVSVAPTRIGLIGGGTDVDPFSLKFGGKVLNIAINLYIETVLTAKKSSVIKIEAMGEKRLFELSKGSFRYGKDPKFDLVRAIINHFRKDLPSGFLLKTEAKFESVGLGGSGAAAVSMIGAFNSWLGKGMSRLEIATLAFLTETEELGWPGGIQDQMAAAFGGINVIPFGFGEDFGAVPLNLDDSAITEFRRWMMIAYMGGYRHSKDQQRVLAKGMSKKERQKALISLREGVTKAARAIEKEDWENLGKLLDDA